MCTHFHQNSAYTHFHKNSVGSQEFCQCWRAETSNEEKSSNGLSRQPSGASGYNKMATACAKRKRKVRRNGLAGRRKEEEATGPASKRELTKCVERGRCDQEGVPVVPEEPDPAASAVRLSRLPRPVLRSRSVLLGTIVRSARAVPSGALSPPCAACSQ